MFSFHQKLLRRLSVLISTQRVEAVSSDYFKFSESDTGPNQIGHTPQPDTKSDTGPQSDTIWSPSCESSSFQFASNHLIVLFLHVRTHGRFRHWRRRMEEVPLALCTSHISRSSSSCRIRRSRRSSRSSRRSSRSSMRSSMRCSRSSRRSSSRRRMEGYRWHVALLT